MAPGGTRHFFVRVQNDAHVADSFFLVGSHSGHGFVISYSSGGKNIRSSVTSGQYWVSVPAGSHEDGGRHGEGQELDPARRVEFAEGRRPFRGRQRQGRRGEGSLQDALSSALGHNRSLSLRPGASPRAAARCRSTPRRSCVTRSHNYIPRQEREMGRFGDQQRRGPAGSVRRAGATLSHRPPPELPRARCVVHRACRFGGRRGQGWSGRRAWFSRSRRPRCSTRCCISSIGAARFVWLRPPTASGSSPTRQRSSSPIVVIAEPRFAGARCPPDAVRGDRQSRVRGGTACGDLGGRQGVHRVAGGAGACSSGTSESFSVGAKSSSGGRRCSRSTRRAAAQGARSSRPIWLVAWSPRPIDRSSWSTSDPFGGDVATALGIADGTEGLHPLSELCEVVDELTPGAFSEAVFPHHEGFGVVIVAAPPEAAVPDERPWSRVIDLAAASAESSCCTRRSVRTR